MPCIPEQCDGESRIARSAERGLRIIGSTLEPTIPSGNIVLSHDIETSHTQANAAILSVSTDGGAAPRNLIGKTASSPIPHSPTSLTSLLKRTQDDMAWRSGCQAGTNRRLLPTSN